MKLTVNVRENQTTWKLDPQVMISDFSLVSIFGIRLYIKEIISNSFFLGTFLLLERRRPLLIIPGVIVPQAQCMGGWDQKSKNMTFHACPNILEWWPTIEEWTMPFHPLLINGGISYLGIFITLICKKTLSKSEQTTSKCLVSLEMYSYLKYKFSSVRTARRDTRQKH